MRMFEHVRVPNKQGGLRILSEIEEYVLYYLWEYTKADPIKDYLHQLDDEFCQVMGKMPEKDTSELLVLLEQLIKGKEILGAEWMDPLFAYVMKINRYHTSNDY